MTERNRYTFDASATRCYPAGSKNPFTHCVVYRMGGTENGTWHRTSAMTPAEAKETAEGLLIVRPLSRPKIVNHRQSIAIGLPEEVQI